MSDYEIDWEQTREQLIKCTRRSYYNCHKNIGQRIFHEMSLEEFLKYTCILQRIAFLFYYSRSRSWKDRDYFVQIVEGLAEKAYSLDAVMRNAPYRDEKKAKEIDAKYVKLDLDDE